MNNFQLHEEAEFLENTITPYQLAREVAIVRSFKYKLKLPWPEGDYTYLLGSDNTPKVFDSYSEVKEYHDTVCCKGVNGVIEVVVEEGV